MNGTRWMWNSLLAASRRLPGRAGVIGFTLTLIIAAAGIGATMATIVSASAGVAGEPVDRSEPLLPSGSEMAAAIRQDSDRSAGPAKLPAGDLMPLEDLQRDEAVAVLNEVFGTSVEEAAGIYDELQSADLLSPHVAVLPEREGAGEVAVGTNPEAPDDGVAGSGDRPGRDEAAEALPEAEALRLQAPPPKEPAEIVEASLLDSTVPLEVDSGETIDLSLEPHGAYFEPVSPLVKSLIPGDLSKRIEFPEVGIGIEVANLSTARSASVTDGSVAFYPNVADDSDLAISPTPTGIETLSHLRSPDSPEIETYRLSLPSDAELRATDTGGAEVRQGSETLLTVPAPTARDAEGSAVPVDLEVSGNSLQIRVDADQSAVYPILVDPLFQTYEWAAKDTARGICSSSTTWQPSETSCSNREEWGYEQTSHYVSHLEIRTFTKTSGSSSKPRKPRR